MKLNESGFKFVAGGGKAIAAGAAEETDTLEIGQVYLLTAIDVPVAVRFSASTVAATDGNFDFVVPLDGYVVARATHATIRAITAKSGSTGILYAARLDPRS